jgi:hypothetical protein
LSTIGCCWDWRSDKLLRDKEKILKITSIFIRYILPANWKALAFRLS